MSERYIHEMLPGMSPKEILDTMTKDQIVDHIIGLRERAAHIETETDLALHALYYSHGVTIEQVLKEREIPDGEPA